MWQPTDLIDFIRPIRSLVIFLAGAMVWEKLKPSGVSLRFAFALSITAALAVMFTLIYAEVFFEWIALKVIT